MACIYIASDPTIPAQAILLAALVFSTPKGSSSSLVLRIPIAKAHIAAT